MRRSNCLGAALLTSAVILGSPGTASASARLDKTVRLRQDTPVSAASRAGGTCPVPADKDGWHFTLAEAPGSITFKSVTVTFDLGGAQTVGAEGRDVHVASERGANLTEATAVVDGPLLVLPLVRYFDLANTCPGQAPPPPPPAADPAPVNQPVQEPQPEDDPADETGTGPGTGTTGTGQKPKPKPTTASATPTVTPEATATTSLPEVPDGIDQPELRVGEDGGTPVAVSADESSGGLGIQGFALISAGAFLLIFGTAATYMTIRGRRS